MSAWFCCFFVRHLINPIALFIVCATSEHFQFFNAFEGTLLLTIFQDSSELYGGGNSRVEKRIPQQSKRVQRVPSLHFRRSSVFRKKWQTVVIPSLIVHSTYELAFFFALHFWGLFSSNVRQMLT